MFQIFVIKNKIIKYLLCLCVLFLTQICTYIKNISWETYMQVSKQQLELDMEQQTGSK